MPNIIESSPVDSSPVDSRFNLVNSIDYIGEESSQIGAKAAKTAESKASTLDIGKRDLRLVCYTLNRVKMQNNADFLLRYLKNTKPSPFVKQVIRETLVNCAVVMPLGAKNMQCVKFDDSKPRGVDSVKWFALIDALNTGDSIACDSIKALFPKVELTKDEIATATQSRIQKQVSKGELTKADLLAMVAALES
jgi:ribosomal protein L22